MKREDLLKKSQKPADDAMKMHPFYRGKIETGIKCIVRGFDDFAIWYSPGVAAPCLDIRDNPDKVFEHTNKGNTVAIITDGTRVLGLGDIGAEASLPVMEGKALLYKYLGGVDAVPIALDTKDPDVFIETALLLQPSFGGYNLEDIAQPKCFKVLSELRNRARIPVWHDDQQGTATVTVAGLMNAVQVVGKRLHEIKVAFVGAGAGNVCIARLCFSAGVDPAKAIICDIDGTLGAFRDDIKDDPLCAEKWKLCQITNPREIRGGIPEAMKGA
ncbi:MAG TPA: NADP-dependent malic enzyme, partial [candidate division Zixibacteria bacterium]|nr:NADP-dependent malic enzyme [candidate division Zixibacteria bacterium]